MSTEVSSIKRGADEAVSLRSGVSRVGLVESDRVTRYAGLNIPLGTNDGPCNGVQTYKHLM